MAENTTEKSRDQQINDLATRVATEFKSVKASIPNTNTLIPKTENRGELAGWWNEGILGAVSYTGEMASFITAGSPDTNEIEDLIKRTIFFMGEEYKNSPLGQFYDSKTSDNGLTKYRKEALKIWPE